MASKVADLRRKTQKGGFEVPEGLDSDFNDIPPTTKEEADKKPPRIVKPLDLGSIFRNKPKPLSFVLPGLLKGTVGFLVGPGSSGKSYLALQTAITKAGGIDCYGLWGAYGGDPKEIERGRVIYCSLEDPADEEDGRGVLQHRIHDAGGFLRGDAEWDDVEENFDVMPLYGEGFSIVDLKDRVSAHEWFKRLVKFAKGDGDRPPACLIILDTFNRAIPGLDECSQSEMGPVMAMLERLCKEIGVAILIVHHVSKQAARGDGGMDTADASRGSNVLTSNSRFVSILRGMMKEDRKTLIVPEEDEGRFALLKTPKANYKERMPGRWLRRGEGGVLTSFDEDQPAVKQEGEAEQPATKRATIARKVLEVRA